MNVAGDIRDYALIERVVAFYKPDSVLTSTKPPLLMMPYQEYVEVNFLAMVEIMQIAEKAGVPRFVYVSSIAASSHYLVHDNADEQLVQPRMMDYEAPYDLTKRLVSTFILSSSLS